MDDFINKLIKRLDIIESRLSAIENNLIKSTNISIESLTVSELAKVDNLGSLQSSVEGSPLIGNITIKKEQGNWLGIIAVICFVLAGAFIIKLSVEIGWLTPVRQISIAIVFSIILIFSRKLLVSIDDKYSSFLPAAGIIILYLAIVAAHLYYSLISFGIAITLICSISSICIWLYMIIKHDVYAIIAAIGTYVTPSITNIVGNEIFSFYYFLLCSVTFSFISVWMHSRTLTLVSSYFAILMTGLVGLNIKYNLLVANILALHFFIFATGAYWYSRINNLPLTVREANAFLPVLLMLYVMEYYFLSNFHAHLAPWISLGFAAILSLLYLSAKKYLLDVSGSEQLVLIFTTIVCFHSLYLEILPDKVDPWLMVIIFIIYAFTPTNFSAEKLQKRFYVPLTAIYLIVAIEYLSLISLFLDGRVNAELLVVTFCSCVSILSVYCNKGQQQGQFLLVAGHLLAVLGLWHLTSNISSLAVSGAWLAYAVCFMIFSYKRKDVVMLRSALFILVLAAVKALLYDASGEDTIVRIVCLLLTGFVLYGSGLLIRSTNKWS